MPFLCNQFLSELYEQRSVLVKAIDQHTVDRLLKSGVMANYSIIYLERDTPPSTLANGTTLVIYLSFDINNSCTWEKVFKYTFLLDYNDFNDVEMVTKCSL